MDTIKGIACLCVVLLLSLLTAQLILCCKHLFSRRKAGA